MTKQLSKIFITCLIYLGSLCVTTLGKENTDKQNYHTIKAALSANNPTLR